VKKLSLNCWISLFWRSVCS